MSGGIEMAHSHPPSIAAAILSHARALVDPALRRFLVSNKFGVAVSPDVDFGEMSGQGASAFAADMDGSAAAEEHDPPNESAAGEAERGGAAGPASYQAEFIVKNGSGVAVQLEYVAMLPRSSVFTLQRDLAALLQQVRFA